MKQCNKWSVSMGVQRCKIQTKCQLQMWGELLMILDVAVGFGGKWSLYFSSYVGAVKTQALYMPSPVSHLKFHAVSMQTHTPYLFSFHCIFPPPNKNQQIYKESIVQDLTFSNTLWYTFRNIHIESEKINNNIK